MANRTPKGKFGTPLKKGQSGNPRGRPKIPEEYKEAARDHTPEALQKLVSLMRDPKSTRSIQLQAANSLLDRGWGKPRQEVEVSGRDGNPLAAFGVMLLPPVDSDSE